MFSVLLTSFKNQSIHLKLAVKGLKKKYKQFAKQNTYAEKSD